MADPFQGYSSLSSQGESWADVVPSDATDLTTVPKALWIGVAGDVKVAGADGVAVTFTVPAGLFPMRARRVWQTGTTATGIKAIY